MNDDHLINIGFIETKDNPVDSVKIEQVTFKKRKKWSILLKIVLPIVIGILTATWTGIQIYDHFTKDDTLLWEQRVDPEAMRKLKEANPGSTIKIEKGVTIAPKDD